MENEFKNVEETFRRLKAKFRIQEISQKEFVDQLKHLRIKDEEGRFWMIGAQTGKWYYFDGTDWIPAYPPSLSEKKAICIYCGFENDLEAESCVRCGGGIKEKEGRVCQACGYELEASGQLCPRCSRKQVETTTVDTQDIPEGTVGERKKSFLFRAVDPATYSLFSGILGIFIGIILGAFIGATDILNPLGNLVPAFLQELRGKLIGGILLAGLGAVAGFAFMGVFGLVQALIFNSISSLFGGIKIRLESVPEKSEKAEKSEEKFLSLK